MILSHAGEQQRDHDEVSEHPQKQIDDLEKEKLRLQIDRANLRTERTEQALKQLREDSRKGHKFQIIQGIVDGTRWIAVIAVAWIPLQAVQPIAAAFAGETTAVNADIRVSIAVAYSVASTTILGVTANQSRLRKKKIKQQRERLDKLEKELESANSRQKEEENAH
ncbi:hypothetical protein [Micromonospora sp. LOL_021]